MKRQQWLELEDDPRLPVSLRDGATDLLDVGFAKVHFYRQAAEQLIDVVRQTGEHSLVDLCSGGGGGTMQVFGYVRDRLPDLSLVLTDRFPNRTAKIRAEAKGAGRVRYLDAPVDAMQPASLPAGVVTMSGALHHFDPASVQSLLGGLVAQRRSLAFFDLAAAPALRRLPLPAAVPAMVVNACVLALASVLLLPLVWPFRLSSWLLTLPIPLLPLLVGFDGTVSAVRAYLPKELLALAKAVPGGDTYEWRAGVAGKALYLTGWPR